MNRILAFMRTGLHLTFAFLLSLGLASYALPDPARLVGTPVLPLAVALAGTYVAGTAWEILHHAGRVARSPARFAPGWLALVTVWWCALVALSADFVWVLFPLVLLALHVLPRWAGLMSAVALWAVAAFVPRLLHPADWSAGSVLGPAVGTVIAVAFFAVYRMLHGEAARHRKVAQQLRATRAELAATEHEAGRMEERERLSREIHDTVAQGLSSILLVSRAAQASLARGDAAAAGITCSMQPSHLMTDWRIADRHWGAARSAGAFALGSLLRSGTLLAFGSDAPVEPVDPRRGLYAAVTRQDDHGEPAGGWFPIERTSAADALAGYTTGPARAAGLPAPAGSIAVGALADIAAWDADPLDDSTRLLDMRCVATIVGGEVVFSR